MLRSEYSPEVSSRFLTLLRISGLLLFVACSIPALGDDWPQWRGPGRNGVSAEKGLLKSWSTGARPKLAWHATGLGDGYAGVVISRGTAYSIGRHGKDVFAYAFHADSGKLRWKQQIGTTGRIPSSTPTVDGDRLYALDPDGDLFCLKTANGSILWQKSFLDDFGGKMMSGRGYGESPLIDGDRLICTPGGNEALLVALNKTTGRLLWKTKSPDLGTAGRDGAAFSSAVVCKTGDNRQYVQFVGRGLVGVDAKTGRLLWSHNKLAVRTANIPTPIVRGNLVFAANGYNAGSLLLKLRLGDQGAVTANEVYRLDGSSFQNHHGGFVLVDGHIFGGHGSNNGLPTCLELQTGRVVWKRRGPGVGSAAVIYADGRLYFRYQNGVMALIEATTKGYRPQGTFRIPGAAGDSWAHPAIANGHLYLREKNDLWVYDIRAAGATATAKTPPAAHSNAEIAALGKLGVTARLISPAADSSKPAAPHPYYRYAANHGGKPRPVLLAALKDQHFTSRGTVSPTILEHLKQLTTPVILDLAGTRVSDAGLARIAGIPQLAGLNLESCRGVTDAGLKNLQPAGALRVLVLTGTAVTDSGLKQVAALKALAALDLEVCDHVTDAGCATLGAMRQLRALNLKKTGFDRQHITNAGLRALRSLSNLRELNLYGNKMTDDGLAHLAGMTDIQTLDLSLLPITDRGLAHLVALRKLLSLKLLMSVGFAGPIVTNAGALHLQKLKQLQSLNLVGAKITDDGLKTLARLKQLQRLVLTNTRVTTAGIDRLKSTHPKCVVVR